MPLFNKKEVRSSLNKFSYLVCSVDFIFNLNKYNHFGVRLKIDPFRRLWEVMWKDVWKFVLLYEWLFPSVFPWIHMCKTLFLWIYVKHFLFGRLCLGVFFCDMVFESVHIWIYVCDRLRLSIRCERGIWVSFQVNEFVCEYFYMNDFLRECLVLWVTVLRWMVVWVCLLYKIVTVGFLWKIWFECSNVNDYVRVWYVFLWMHVCE